MYGRIMGEMGYALWVSRLYGFDDNGALLLRDVYRKL